MKIIVYELILMVGHQHLIIQLKQIIPIFIQVVIGNMFNVFYIKMLILISLVHILLLLVMINRNVTIKNYFSKFNLNIFFLAYDGAFSWRNYLTELNQEPVPFECFSYVRNDRISSKSISDLFRCKPRV
jgi:hypothetical protein